MLVWHGAAVAVALAGPGVASAALDNEQFCKAMVEIARVGKAEDGHWIDRHTRDDGIEVLCRIRTVNYKRFVKSGPGALGAADWKERKEREWNSIACTSSILRDAVDNGWIISSTITAATGERVLVIATCK
jgi:hypothetical protein